VIFAGITGQKEAVNVRRNRVMVKPFNNEQCYERDAQMKRFFLTLIVFCVIFTSGAILTGALTLGDDMWLPYVGTVHYQMDDIPGVTPAKHFDA